MQSQGLFPLITAPFARQPISTLIETFIVAAKSITFIAHSAGRSWNRAIFAIHGVGLSS